MNKNKFLVMVIVIAIAALIVAAIVGNFEMGYEATLLYFVGYATLSIVEMVESND